MFRSKTKARIQSLLILLFLFGMITFANGTIISKIYKVVFASLAILYLLYSRIPIVRTYHFGWMLAVLLFDCLSYSWAYSKVTAIEGIKTVGLNTLCVGLVSLLIAKDKKWIETVSKGIIMFPSLRFLSAFLRNGFAVFGGLRNIAGFRDYNTIAMFAAFGTLFAFFQYRYIKKTNYARFFGIVNLIIVGLSLSRKGLLYLLIPLIILYISESENISKTLRNIIIACIIIVILYALVMNVPTLYNLIGSGMESALRYFVSGSGDSSSAARNDRIVFGLRMINARPWLGYGVQNYNYFFSISGHITENMIVADNNYIDVLFNTGIVGIVLYYIIYVISIVKHAKNRNKSIINKLGFSVLITLAICDYGVSSYLYMHSQFFLALSIMLLLYKQDNSTRGNTDRQSQVAKERGINHYAL